MRKSKRQKKNFNQLIVLPEVLIDKIIDYIPDGPGWNVAFTCKRYYNKIKDESIILRKSLRANIRDVFFLLENKAYVNNTDRLLSLLSSIRMVESMTYNLIRARKLYINIPFTQKMNDIMDDLDEYKSNWCIYIQNHGRPCSISNSKTKNFFRKYEIYLTLHSLFDSVTKKTFHIEPINLSAIQTWYRTTPSVHFLFNYITYKDYNFPHNIEVINIVYLVYNIIKEYSIYLSLSSDFDHDIIELETLQISINRLLILRARLIKYPITSDNNIAISRIVGYDLSDYSGDWDQIEYLNEFCELYETAELSEFLESNDKMDLEFWYLLESIISNIPIRSQFLKKIKSLSRINDLMYYITFLDQ